MLPAELQLITVYSAGVTTSAKEVASREGADQGADRAVGGADLQGQGLDPA